MSDTDEKEIAEKGVFGLYDRPGARFEASGVARIPDSDLLLVVNDKGKKVPEERLALVALEGDDLEVVRCMAATSRGHVLPARGFEDAAGSKRYPGVVYAITSYSKDDSTKRHLIRLQFGPDGRFVDSHDIPLAAPEAAMGPEIGYINVEALALTPSEDRVLVGLRCWGPSKQGRRFGVALLSYSLDAPHQAPDVLARLDLQPLLGRSEGLAAMEYVPELGGYLLVTSYEDKATETLGGHLWYTPTLDGLGDLRRWETMSRLELPDKPEGACLGHEGNIVVVFDHDKKRKARAGLAQHEATYVLIDPDSWLDLPAPTLLSMHDELIRSTEPIRGQDRGPFGREVELWEDPLHEGEYDRFSIVEARRVSGSSQFSAPGLEQLAARLRGAAPDGARILILDTREEPHGFSADGRPISWRTLHNWKNIGLPFDEIIADEKARVGEAGGSTEAELCERAGLDYYRIPITDHVRPMEDDIDEVIKLVRSLPPETWIHVHCRKGIGRTGMIMTTLAMLRDPHGAATAEEVAGLCGASHLFKPSEYSDLKPHKAYKHELKKDRKAFLQRLLEYARSGTDEPWSAWSRDD
jgi:hypothetical protein